MSVEALESRLDFELWDRAFESGMQPVETEPNGDEVYMAVQPIAWQLSIMNPKDSTRRDEFYGEHGVKPAVITQVETEGPHRLFVVDDTVQVSGAFKYRGARSKVLEIRERNPKARILSTYSSGNHGNSTTLVGNEYGLETHVYHVSSISEAKKATLKANGAILHEEEEFHDAKAASELASEDPLVELVPPFDDIYVIAGQASLGYEIVYKIIQLYEAGIINLKEDRNVIEVPVGGAGLINGVAFAVRHAEEEGWIPKGSIEVVGVQMEGNDAVNRAKQGYLEGHVEDTLFEAGEFNPECDGTAVKNAGNMTLPAVADTNYVARIETVTPARLGKAMGKLAVIHGKAIEPAGSLGMAGAEEDAVNSDRKTNYFAISSGDKVAKETIGYFDDMVEQEEMAA